MPRPKASSDKKPEKKTTAPQKTETKKDPSLDFLEELRKSGELGVLKRVEILPTGSRILNGIIGDGTNTDTPGGYPKGYVTEIFGDQSTGKTTLALHAAKNAIAAGGRVVWADFEHNLPVQKSYIENIGLNTEPPNFIYLKPLNFEDGVKRIGESLFRLKPPPALIVIDSVTAMMPKVSVEDNAGSEVQIGKHAKLVGNFLNWITKYLDDKNTTLLLLNQVRTNVKTNKYDPGPMEISSGGKAPGFFTTVRVQLKPTNLKEEVTTSSSVTGEIEKRKVSQAVKAIVVKNKFDKPFRTGPIYITFGKGVDNIMSLILLAENKKIIKTAGSWLSWESPDKKHSFKVQNRSKLVTYLENNPDVIEALMPFLTPSVDIGAMFQRKEELEAIGEDNLSDDEHNELLDLRKRLSDKDKPADSGEEFEHVPEDEVALAELNQIAKGSDE